VKRKKCLQKELDGADIVRDVRFCDYTSILQVSGITEVWGDQKKDSHVARYTARTARTQSSFEGPFAINACL